MAKELTIFDSKIIILYILDNSSKPLSLEQVAKLCEEFEDITYFDICTYIEDLKQSFYIEECLADGTMTYTSTPLGSATVQELLELIPGVNLRTLKKVIHENMNEMKKAFSIDTTIIPIRNDEFKVSCYIKEGNDEFINITLYAGTKEQAKNISKKWNHNAEEIYTKLLEMLTN